MGRSKKFKVDESSTVSDPLLGTPVSLTLTDFSTPAPAPDPENSIIENPVIDIGINQDLPLGEKQKRSYKKREKKTENGGDEPFFDGEMLMLFCDIVFPALIAFGSNSLTGTKIDSDKMMLTDKQISKMKRFADKAAEKMNFEVNPIVGFIGGMGACYFANYVKEKNK